MSEKPKILAFAGSARRESLNKKLIRAAAEIAESEGAEVTVVDFAELELPLYELGYQTEHGVHENAVKFRELLHAHDGFVISTPEHNGSISALLKNALDWASRAGGDEPALACFDGKPCALMAASPGGLGGMRSLAVARMVLNGFRILLLPDQLAVGNAEKLFDESGTLTDNSTRKKLQAVMQKLVKTIRGLKS